MFKFSNTALFLEHEDVKYYFRLGYDGLMRKDPNNPSKIEESLNAAISGGLNAYPSIMKNFIDENPTYEIYNSREIYYFGLRLWQFAVIPKVLSRSRNFPYD